MKLSDNDLNEMYIMSLVNKCNLIINRMSKLGYEVVDNCNGWDESELEYFVINYENSYIENWDYNEMNKIHGLQLTTQD